MKTPVVVWQGQIIDGRHRARACKELDIEPPSTEFQGDEAQALALVISLNATRRDLKPTQRAMVAARLVSTPAHRPGKAANLQTSVEAAAQMLGVSRRFVAAARFVIVNGSPEMVASCERGEQRALDIETLIRKLQNVLVENHQATLRQELAAEEAGFERGPKKPERDTPMPDVVGRCRTILELI